MNARQKRFCEEYIIDLNGARAAISSGYSEKTAKTIASENLTKPDLAAYIQELLEKREKETGITANKVLKDIEEIRERCMQKEEVLDAEGKPTGEWKFESFAALKACELLGKYLKMWTEKVEHSFLDGLGERIAKSRKRMNE